jgi:hypothetical protein
MDPRAASTEPDGTAEEAGEGAESSTVRLLAAAPRKRRGSPISRSH